MVKVSKFDAADYLKSPEAIIVKKEQNVINVTIWKLVNDKTFAAITKAIMK